jgi:hypothetical protein
MTLPRVGEWVRWVNPDFAREGVVEVSSSPSLVIRWLGISQPQVFPNALHYFAQGGDMTVIPRPPKAAKIDRQMKRGRKGIAAAAAALGITEKRVRQRLRNGSLKGRQVDGKWVEVNVDE